MGKRKRTASPPSADPPSDSTPCSSGRDATPGENSSEDSSVFKRLKGIMDNHSKHPNSQFSLGQHHYNMSRATFLKRSRHHYGNQYSRRNSPNYHKPTTSYGKGGPFHDERLCLKFGSRHNSDLGHRPDFTEFREKSLWRPERIRTSSVVIDAAPSESSRRICGICQRSLRQKPQHFGNNIASEELSIAAVLVCGHIYHADCLEQRTRPEDAMDPPCPMCLGLIPDTEGTWI